MRGAVSLTVYTEGRSLGWANIFRGKVWSSREKTASSPGRKVSSCRTWCLGSVSAVAFWGRVYSCQERIASFPMRKVSNCRTRETTWCLDTGSAVAFRGRVYSYREGIASFPRRKVSNCRTRETAWCLDTGRAVTFRGRVYSCRGRIASLPGREVSYGQCGEIAYSLTCRVGLTAYYLTVTLGWTGTFREKVTSCWGDCLLPREEGEQWPGWGCGDLPD